MWPLKFRSNWRSSSLAHLAWARVHRLVYIWIFFEVCRRRTFVKYFLAFYRILKAYNLAAKVEILQRYDERFRFAHNSAGWCWAFALRFWRRFRATERVHRYATVIFILLSEVCLFRRNARHARFACVAHVARLQTCALFNWPQNFRQYAPRLNRWIINASHLPRRWHNIFQVWHTNFNLLCHPMFSCVWVDANFL